MKIKIGTGSTHLEQSATRARADRLGLQSEGDQALGPNVVVSEASMKNVAGGPAAVQALASADGILDANAIGQLRQNSSWFGRLLGRDLPIDKKQTQAVQALSMELDGLNSSLAGAAKDPGGDLAGLERRLGHFTEHLERLMFGDTATLAQAEPAAIGALGAKLTATTDTTAKLLTQLSAQRSEGGADPKKADAQLDLADRLIGSLQAISIALTSGPSADTPPGASGFADLMAAQAKARTDSAEGATAVAAQLSTRTADNALKISADSDLGKSLVKGMADKAAPLLELVAGIAKDPNSSPLVKANAIIEYAGDTLGNPNVALDADTKRALSAVIGKVIDGAKTEYDRRIDYVERQIALGDPDNDKAFHWTKLIAKSPGSDWGFYGAAEVAGEKRRGLNNLKYAKDNIAYLARPLAGLQQLAELAGVSKSKLPSSKAITNLLERVESNGKRIGGRVEGIMAGQLEGMMQVQGLGGRTALSGDDIKKLYS